MVAREDILINLRMKNIILLIREESLLVKENLCLRVFSVSSFLTSIPRVLRTLVFLRLLGFSWDFLFSQGIPEKPGNIMTFFDQSLSFS